MEERWKHVTVWAIKFSDDIMVLLRKHLQSICQSEEKKEEEGAFYLNTDAEKKKMQMMTELSDRLEETQQQR